MISVKRKVAFCILEDPMVAVYPHSQSPTAGATKQPSKKRRRGITNAMVLRGTWYSSRSKSVKVTCYCSPCTVESATKQSKK